MRCISLYQPWASLMALGHKTIETRSWGTSYRGLLAIHASKRLVMPPDPEFRQAIVELGLMKYEWPLGQIVGICRLLDCVTITPHMPLSGYEHLFGDFTVGRVAWLTSNMENLIEPVKCVGRQGLFEWTRP